MRWFVVLLASCGSAAPGPISAAACTEQCIRLAGGGAPFCATVCDSTCAQRCNDLLGRAGDQARCSEVCASTCPELQQKYDFGAELCGWIVEDRPSPAVTPHELRTF